jgi:hypothetical protein
MDKPSLPYSIIWFSHKENKYDAELKIFQEKSIILIFFITLNVIKVNNKKVV